MPIGATSVVEAQTNTDWSTYLFDNARTGFNPNETGIASSAAKLRLLWTSQSAGPIATQPVVGNGLVYWGSWDGYLRATNSSGLNAGQTAWKTYVGRTLGGVNCSPRSAGLNSTPTLGTATINGVARSLVYVGGGGNVDSAGKTLPNAQARFYALDAQSGAVVWQTALGAAPANFAWSSPALFDGSIFFGLASFGDCPLTQGKLLKLNAQTGVLQASFKVVRDGCSGGGIWGSPSIDSARRTVYINTGTPSSCTPDPYSAAVVELRASDLSVVGSWSVPKAARARDGDFGSVVTLFSATIAGQITPLAGVANKNGQYYTFRREQISAGPIWQRTIAVGGQCPTCGDGSISPSAWDGTNLYVAGGKTTIKGVKCQGAARALNPATGAVRWETCLAAPVLSALTAVPGVLMFGEFSYPLNGAQNHLMLLDASSGKSLKSYPNPGGGNFFGAASASNGVVYIGDVSGKLYAFGP